MEDDWEIMGGGKKSRDKKVNKEGRVLLGRIKEVGWEIFNGNMKRDEERDWTYTVVRGEAVIDYVIGSRKVKEGIEWLEIGESVGSDYHPVVIGIRAREKVSAAGGKGRRNRWVVRGG